MSSYGPVVGLCTFLTDGREMFNFWTDAGLAVFVEPQTGSFYANVAMGPGGTLTGQVTFSDMKYVNYVNVSIGSAPGQYINETFAPSFMDSTTGVGVSGFFNGVIPVTFTTKGISGPVELHMVAGGYNDLSLKYSFFGFSFVSYSIQNPIVWSDPISIGSAVQDNSHAVPASTLPGAAVAYVSVIRKRK